MESDPALDELEQMLQDGGAPVQRMHVKNDEVFSCTAKQLRAACSKNPNHPHATIYRNAVLGAPDDHEVHVSKVDLQALLENKTVRIETGKVSEVVGGRELNSIVETKYLN